MTRIRKVTDPAKKVTDLVLLSALGKQGIDKDYVEFVRGYAPRSIGKEHSPYAKFYRDLKSNKRFMVASSLPMVKPDGKKIEVGFTSIPTGGFRSKANLFLCEVAGKEVTLTCLSDQPDGSKEGERVAWRPQLFLDGSEINGGQPTLLPTDPTGGNYRENTLEWSYGICKRRIRIIEGRFRERWIFGSNPHGTVRIKHNFDGSLKLRLGSARDAEGNPLRVSVIGDEEIVEASEFDKAVFPVQVGATATYYPDADPETNTFDGYWGSVNAAGDSWADIRNGINEYGNDADDDIYPCYIRGYDNTYWRNLTKANYGFDVSPLNFAVILATTLYLYGFGKSDGLSCNPDTNVYSSSPASNTTALGNEAADWDNVGSTPYCDTPIDHDTWNTGTPGTSNDFVFNAAGIAAIQAAADGSTVVNLGMRNAKHDVADSPPAVSAAFSHMTSWSADKGTDHRPKLIVTYTFDKLVTPGTLALTLTTYAPTITITQNVYIVPGTLALTLTPHAPKVSVKFPVPLGGAMVVTAQQVGQTLLKDIIPSYSCVIGDGKDVTTVLTALLAYQEVTRITLGGVSPPLDSIIAVGFTWKDIWEACKIIRDTVGGYLHVIIDSADPTIRKLWLTSTLGDAKGQQIRLGKNLTSIHHLTDYIDYANRLYPVGDSNLLLSTKTYTRADIAPSEDGVYGYLTLMQEYGAYKDWTGEGDALPANIDIEKPTGAWISPTGHTGSAAWTYPERAYDGNEASTARKYAWTAYSWTGLLTLTHAGVTCNAVRFPNEFVRTYDMGPWEPAKIKVEVYYLGGWHTIWDQISWGPPEWLVASFGQQTVTSVRLNYYNTGNNTGFVCYVAEVTLWDDTGYANDDAQWEQGADERTVRCDIGDYTAGLGYVISYTHAAYLIELPVDARADVHSAHLSFPVSDVDILLAQGRVKLAEVMEPVISVATDIIDLSVEENLAFEALELGSTVVVIDEGLDIELTTNIVRLNKPDLFHPDKVIIELSTKLKDIIDYLKEA